MGFLLDGVWSVDADPPRDAAGHFVRPASPLRSWVTSDGAPGPSGEGGFKAEAGRYLLYVSLACPWAHRTIIFRKLKGLESLIAMSVVHWHLGDDGWSFAPGDGVVADPIHGAKLLRDVYIASDKAYTGRVSVPILWDKARSRIVNNDSADIIRMLNSAFDGVGAAPGDFYPPALRAEIDALNARVYASVNNGVYRAGFAGAQAAYDEAVGALFESLDWLEARLADRRFLCGDALTEADWRLFTTLIRFDAVYVGHFKCNLRRVADMPNLQRYLKSLYHWPGVAKTVDFHHIKQHYYGSHPKINPSGIVPIGPDLRL